MPTHFNEEEEDKPLLRNEKFPSPSSQSAPSLSQRSTLQLRFFNKESSRNQSQRKLSDGFTPLAAKPSILLPRLQLWEKQFFELVSAGDILEVNEFLEENAGFNINCINFQGITALHLAVQNHNELMVEFLLSQKDIDIGDCILHAIRDNQPTILEMLLQKLQKTAPRLEFVGVMHSSDFPDHITPLILAAQCGHYEIIEMLIERGHQIKKPHAPQCPCAECLLRYEQEDLLHAESLRINLYRAVANPAYICQSSNDPILTAFELSHELRECAMVIPEFRAAYSQLEEEVSAFAVELIGCCRSTQETELIFRQKSGITTAEQYVFPRIALALEYKQKNFIAHPNTEQMLESVWYGDWHEWKFKNYATRTVYPVYRLIMLPIITIMCVVAPRHKLVRHWSIPLNKMISHNSSYLLFLLLLLLESNLDKTEQKRKPPNSGLEPFIILYVLGNIWSSIRLCAVEGPQRYFQQTWHYHTLIMNLLFVSTFVFWIASLSDVQQNGQVDLERKYWHYLDPVLLAEGTFALATVMAFVRLLILYRLSYYLGPLQISLSMLGGDVAKYLAIFFVTILSFTVGMCKFYQYYEGMVQNEAITGIKNAQVASFVNFKSTLRTFFWAVFCMSPLESADVIIENLPGATEGATIINKHIFTEAIGYAVFALFEIITVIIIVNMLIATMSHTFQRIMDNVAVEWTYGKAELYSEYILQTTLPSPFNLIPTANGCMSVVYWFQIFASNPPNKAARCDTGNCCFVESELDEKLAKDFPILMSHLIQRYFREKNASVDTSKTDIEILREDVGEVRKKLEDYLKNN